MHMKGRRGAGAIAALAIVGAACGGGDAAETPQTEAGAAEAVKRAQEGVLQGDGDAVLAFMSDECRATIDEDEIRLAVRFLGSLFEEDDVDLGDVEVITTLEEYDGDTAEVAIEYVLPDGLEDDGLFFNETTVDVVYENDRWVDAGCEFGDEDEIEADELATQLDALGYAGTRDDPIPLGVGAPVGAGFTVSVDAVNPDAKAEIDAGGGFYGDADPGNQYVLVDLTVGYSGSDEPASIGDLSFSVVGGSSSVGGDLFAGSGVARELSAYGTSLLTGGVTSGALCGQVPTADIDGMALAIERSFSDNTVFFDPTISGTAVAVEGASGPQPDGSLTAERQDPIAVGTATDVGEGWTLTVNGLNPDAAAVIAANDFNEPAPDGSEYVLVDVTLAFAGEGSMSPAAVDLDLVGDSNVAVGGGGCSVSFDSELDRFADVFAPGEVTGEVCFLVASSDVASLQLLGATGFGNEPEVFAVR